MSANLTHKYSIIMQQAVVDTQKNKFFDLKLKVLNDGHKRGSLHKKSKPFAQLCVGHIQEYPHFSINLLKNDIYAVGARLTFDDPSGFLESRVSCSSNLGYKFTLISGLENIIQLEVLEEGEVITTVQVPQAMGRIMGHHLMRMDKCINLAQEQDDHDKKVKLAVKFAQNQVALQPNEVVDVKEFLRGPHQDHLLRKFCHAIDLNPDEKKWLPLPEKVIDSIRKKAKKGMKTADLGQDKHQMHYFMASLTD